MKRINLLIAISIGMILLGASLWRTNRRVYAFANTIHVVNTNDSGAGSLRQAINDAASGDTIDFTLSGCPCTITLTSGELVINKNLTITGPGANQLTISGNNASRVFFINPGAPGALTGPPANNISFNFSNLTIANGRAKGGNGGFGECGGGGGGAAGMGGGVFVNRGTVTISDVTFTGNQAQGGNAGGGGQPGYCGGGGGGGVGGDGATASSGSGGNGGSLGGSTTSAGIPGHNGGDGSGGGAISLSTAHAGNGGFGGGGSGANGGGSGNGGFGGGGGGDAVNSGSKGNFGGNPSGFNGGGGAGLGGAIFIRAGSLSLSNTTLTSNSAIGGTGGSSGKGKGGGVFVCTATDDPTCSATASAGTTLTLSSNTAADAGSTCTDNNNIYGPLITPTQLGFATQLNNTTVATTLNSVSVQLQDACGNSATGSTASITLAIGNNSGGAVLGGTTTVNAVNGVATFTNLTLDRAGPGYTLVASSNGLTSATSNSFNITCPTIDLTPITLPVGKFNDSYPSTILTPTAGAGPYQFTVTGLPAGMTYTITTSNVTIGGTPTQSGTFSVVVKVSDNYTCDNGANGRTYSLTIKPIIDEGTYTMKVTSGNKCIQPQIPYATAGIKLIQNTCTGGNEQKWQLQHLGNNVYRLTNVATGLVLETAGGLLSDYAPVDQGVWSNAASQKWQFRKVGKAFELVSTSSNLLLEVLGIPVFPGADNSTINGVTLDQHTSTGTANQQFIFQ